MIIVRRLGMQEYLPTWEKMQEFTKSRDKQTPDECWLLEHPAVYTQGLAGKAEHILNPGKIPIISSDRGGQVTYHGPGQIVAYILTDLVRRNIGIRSLVSELETILISLLEKYGLNGTRRCKAPGVYVDEKKLHPLVSGLKMVAPIMG